MIPCTGDCVYQAEGQCGLIHAASKGSSAKGDCRYRVSRGAGHSNNPTASSGEKL